MAFGIRPSNVCIQFSQIYAIHIMLPPDHEADCVEGHLQLRGCAQPHGPVRLLGAAPGEGEGDAAAPGQVRPEGGLLPVAQVVDVPTVLQIVVVPPVVEAANISWQGKINNIMNESPPLINSSFHKRLFTSLAALSNKNMFKST